MLKEPRIGPMSGVAGQNQLPAVKVSQRALRKRVVRRDPFALDTNLVVGAYPQNVAVVRRMMERTKGQTVLNGGDSLGSRIRHDVRALQQRTGLQLAYGTPATIHVQNIAAEIRLMEPRANRRLPIRPLDFPNHELPFRGGPSDQRSSIRTCLAFSPISERNAISPF